MHQAHAAHRRLVAETGDAVLRGGGQQLERPLGDDRHARAVGDHAGHRRQGGGHRDRGLGAIALAQGQSLVAQAVALVEQEEGLVVELGGAHVRAAGPGVVGGGEDDEPLVEHRDRGGALEVVLQGDDGGVEAPLGELVEVVPGDHLTQVQVHLGQGLTQAVDENGGQVGRDGGDDAQAHRAAQRGALAGGGLAEGLGGQDGVPGVGQQGLAQGGDQDAAGGALHQLAADALLQCGDGLGQAGLADSERRGGLAEVLVVAQRYEGPQLGEGRR